MILLKCANKDTLSEAREPETHLHERTMAVSKLHEGLALIEASIKLLWQTPIRRSSKQQQINSGL
jgi:hypothetical protein